MKKFFKVTITVLLVAVVWALFCVILIASTDQAFDFHFWEHLASIKLILNNTFAFDASVSIPLPAHVARPAILKGVYVTSWSAGSKNYINNLVSSSKTSGINTVVIDVKDYSGYLSYNSNFWQAKQYGASQSRISNIKTVIDKLHGAGIYAIARITMFQDPVLAKARPDLAIKQKQEIPRSPEATGTPVPGDLGASPSPSPLISPIISLSPTPVPLWTDNKGINWMDPASKEVQDYNIGIAQDALANGFDEINFDYVRFPSDGKLSDMVFPAWDKKIARHLIIKDFFANARTQMPDAKLSVDLFGLSTINSDDLGIGQVIEDAFPYMDYIYPMVYPSHYASSFLGYKNPAEYPYQVISYSLQTAKARLDNYNVRQNALATAGITPRIPKIVPWLQDFDLGAKYDAGMVNQEIQATKDSQQQDYSGFILWNPSNYYDSAIFSLLDSQ